MGGKLNIRPEVNLIKDKIINWRRDFHQHPELGFKEFRTAKRIKEILAEMSIDSRSGVGKTGLIADITFGEGPSIALRADMDALPIQESSELEFSSKNDGVMHACGHDGHMAMLLGAAELLINTKNKLKGTVRLIFQPAEEGGGGARYMIEDGCLKNIKEIYGIHVWNYQPLGEIGVKEGPVLAAADEFDIVIEGKGGHGAAPQGTIDAIVVSSQLINSIQTIVSRNSNPLESTVITIGKIKGGDNHNIIADRVSLTGTVRAYSEDNRLMVKNRLGQIIEGVSKMSGANISLKYHDGYPPTINHKEPTKKVLNAAQKVVGEKAGDLYLSMGGEDFSYYLQKVPGCFFFVGSAPNKNQVFETPHHCSHFTMDENALLVGTSVYMNLIEDILGV